VSAPRLVCFGNLTVDDVVLPDGTERPGCTGGDALYAALAARLFEPSAEMVAPVGTDVPAAMRDEILRAGFSLEGLKPRDRPTLHNRVAYRADGGRAWTLYNGEADFHILSPTPDDIPERYRGADAFLILAMTLAAQEELVPALRRMGAGAIALDPQEDYILGAESRVKDLVGQVDIFMPSEEEVRRLLGHADLVAAAKHFAALGPRVVVVKRGGEGCLVYERDADRMSEVPAFPVAEVLDTTGAGDSFCGAFMASLLLAPGDFLRAAQAGAVAASYTVAGFGTEALARAAPADAARRLAAFPALAEARA
jgi:sugar/nucleoside kinase (ribokinase family)